jgi:hypothetical protein
MIVIRNVPTTELREGDLVLFDVLRVRLGTRSVHTHDNAGGTTVRFIGQVENLDEVRSLQYLRGLLGPNGRWDIQGGHAARWNVEVIYIDGDRWPYLVQQMTNDGAPLRDAVGREGYRVMKPHRSRGVA